MEADDLDRVKHVFRQFDLNGDGAPWPSPCKGKRARLTMPGYAGSPAAAKEYRLRVVLFLLGYFELGSKESE